MPYDVYKAAKANERTNLLLNAMEKNTSLVDVVFFGESRDEAIWKQKACELIKRNRINIIAKAPANIQRELLRSRQEYSSFDETDPLQVFMAMEACDWDPDLISRVKALAFGE
jgi:hypothetical protein